MLGSVGRVPRRAAGVVWEELAGEFLVVVPDAGVVHHLSGDAARVWRASVTGAPVELDSGRLAAAVAGLSELGLLEEHPGVPRRTLLVGAGAGAVAALGILSVPLPAAADTGSGTSGGTPVPNGTMQTAVTGSMITLAPMSVISYSVIGGKGGYGGGTGADFSGLITNNTNVPITLAVTVGSNGGQPTGGSGHNSGGSGGQYTIGGRGFSGGGGGGSSALVDVTGTPSVVAVEAGGGGGGGSGAAGTSGTLAGGGGNTGTGTGASGAGFKQNMTVEGGGGGGTVGGSSGVNGGGGNAGSSTPASTSAMPDSSSSTYTPAVSGITVTGSVSVTATDNNASGTNTGVAAGVTFKPTTDGVTYTA